MLRALVGVLFAPNDAVDVFQSDTRPATSQDREFVNKFVTLTRRSENITSALGLFLLLLTYPVKILILIFC